MRRRGHGETHDPNVMEVVRNTMGSMSVLAGMTSAGNTFGYMFPDAQDADDVLSPGPQTVTALKALGASMTDDPETSPVGGVVGVGDSGIPAIYTYFGQFVDHDITLDETSASITQLSSPDLTPLSSLSGLRNGRTVRLDLDSVYEGGAPRDAVDDRKMQVGPVEQLDESRPKSARPPGKSDLNDLPRQSRSEDETTDRAAIIGDPRNDENLIVSQLHVAFLKAHNSLVDGGEFATFEKARSEMRSRYQRIVLTDYLPRVCDPTVLDEVLRDGPRFWHVEDPAKLFMPVEFAVAAYRFGHSMVRTLYDYNLNFAPTTLDVLFTFTALSGQIGQNIGVPADQSDTLPENWIIEWERFVEHPNGSGKPQMARRIDPRLTEFTFKLQNTFGRPEGSGAGGSPNPDENVRKIAPRLAIRNLLRGYLLRLPTGQAVAARLDEPVLRGNALLRILPTDTMREAARPFADRTPLWFYVLAEAGDPDGAAGKHLGRVGSRILAEVFWNLARHSKDSVLVGSGPPKKYTLAELIALAGEQDRVGSSSAATRAAAG